MIHLIEHCIKKRIEDRLKSSDVELQEALAIIREENQKTQELLRKAMGND